MSDKTSIVDIIQQLHINLDSFKDNWIQNNKINPEHWPLEISNDNTGIVFEQFSTYDPSELIEPTIDLDVFINNIGFTSAYNIIKRRPPMAQCYHPASKSYYQMEAFCIDLDTLKIRLDELTKDKKIKVIFSYTDHDWPYAYQDDTIVILDSYLAIDEWIEKNTGNRESYSIKEVEWTNNDQD